jgi:phytoene desaturase
LPARRHAGTPARQAMERDIMSRVVVIGGGFGGIAAALRARAKGHEVTLVDRCPRLGGRAQVFERDGFRHDAGPTVVTAPFLFAELFALFGCDIADYVNIVPLPLWYRFYFQDGDTFDYGGGIEETLAEIRRIHPPDADGYLALLEQSRKIYDVGFTALADVPFDRFGFMAKQIPHLLRLGAYRSVWQMVSTHVSHEKIRQAFSIQPLLVGGNPFDTTSIYALIHFLERAHGVHFAMGGTGALVDALERLMRQQGIEIKLNTTVTDIEIHAGAVRAIRTDRGERLSADIVISNADPVYLYRAMLPQEAVALSARIKTRYAEQSMGLFVLYFGTRRQYSHVAHHTIWMGPRYRELLSDIFHRKVLAEDFSIYLHRPTATDPSFAPESCDSFYALVPVPNLTASINWQVEGPKLRDRVVAALDATILPGLNQTICSDFFMTPADFEGRYLSPAGAGFSIAPRFYQSAWFRFHNRGEGPRNLYLVGAGSHPGAGLPGVLCSAKVVDRLLPKARAPTHAARLVAVA